MTELIRIDKSDGSESVVTNHEEAFARLASQLDCKPIDAHARLRAFGRVETCFAIYEIREGAALVFDA